MRAKQLWGGARGIRRLTGAAGALGIAVGVLAAPVGAGTASAAVSCVKEKTPPAITSFDFSPVAVDVRTGAKTVSVVGTATDAGSGVANMMAMFVSPRGANGKTSYAYATMKLSSGTAAKGTFKGSAAVSRWVIPGGWQVLGVYATDKAGNVSPFLGYQQLADKGWRRDLAVTSTPDVTAPALTAFTFSPASVDTRSAAKQVMVTAKATDSQSGVLSIGVTFTRPTAVQKTAVAGLRRVSGTAANGTYSGYVTIPRWMGNASWQASVTVADAAFNTSSYSYAALGTKRWPRVLKVVSGADSTIPSLTAEAFSPATVDIRAAAKTVTATASARDTGSGVIRVAITWTSPSKGQSVTASLSRVSGNAFNGGWSGRAVVPLCAEPGTWTASAQVSDVAGNVRNYTTAQLAASWPKYLKVVGVDSVAPSMTGPSTVPAAGPATFTFDEPVKGLSAATLAISDGISSAPVAGTWGCKTAAGAAVSCATGPVKTASFTPSSPFSGFFYKAEMNPASAGAAAITDLTGNPGSGTDYFSIA